MCAKSVDDLVFDDDWGDLTRIKNKPQINDVPQVDDFRHCRPQVFFESVTDIDATATALADDVVAYLDEIGSRNRRVAIEYVNPSVTQALEARGVEVIDGVHIIETGYQLLTTFPYEASLLDGNSCPKHSRT